MFLFYCPYKLAALNDFANYILILAMEGRRLMFKVDKIRFEVNSIFSQLREKNKMIFGVFDLSRIMIIFRLRAATGKLIKFIFYKKATKIGKIYTIDLTFTT